MCKQLSLPIDSRTRASSLERLDGTALEAARSVSVSVRGTRVSSGPPETSRECLIVSSHVSFSASRGEKTRVDGARRTTRSVGVCAS